MGDFAVFILTHGRADNVRTYQTLRRQGYTGAIYLVVDDEDKQLSQYCERYGNQVIVFSKGDYVDVFDIGDNFAERNTVTYARNAAWNIARQMGINWFLELDDDYTQFIYKYTSNLEFTTEHPEIHSLDKLFQILLDFYKTTQAASIAMAQGGDFIGGEQGAFGKRLWMKRKTMNTFFCCSHRPFEWYGRMNDDVNTYLVHGNRGRLFGQIPSVCVEQADTQSALGGLTDMYLRHGTYVKSFYSVMYEPSFVRVYPDTHMARLHHRINWNAAVPCIVSEKVRKCSTQA